MVSDTHNIVYHTTFAAKDAEGGNDSVTLAWSDACNIPQSGTWNISSYGNCTESSLDGVQSGNVTISTYTLTLNAQFAFTPGNTVTINSGGKIAIGGGGSLKKGYLYYQTSSTYCAGVNPLYFNTASSWSGYSLSSGVTLSLSQNWWPNVGTGEGANDVSPTVSCSQPTGYVNNNNCDDSDPSVYPGQTAFFTAADTAGNYDYAYNGIILYYYPYLPSGAAQSYCTAEGRSCGSGTYASYPYCQYIAPYSYNMNPSGIFITNYVEPCGVMQLAGTTMYNQPTNYYNCSQDVNDCIGLACYGSYTYGGGVYESCN